VDFRCADLEQAARYKPLIGLVCRPIGRLYGDRYCTTRQRFELPGPLPE